MENLLAALNSHGFAFDRDFVLRVCPRTSFWIA
jgi:hypothetical protein